MFALHANNSSKQRKNWKHTQKQHISHKEKHKHSRTFARKIARENPSPLIHGIPPEIDGL
jgi:hypothetical protein